MEPVRFFDKGPEGDEAYRRNLTKSLNVLSARLATVISDLDTLESILETATTWTPVVDGGGTLAATNSYYHKIGNLLKGNFNVTLGTVAAATCAVSLPPEWVIDSSRCVANQFLGVINHLTSSGVALDIGATTFAAFYDGSDETKIFVTNLSASVAFTKRNTNVIFSSGGKMVGFFEVPVVAA